MVKLDRCVGSCNTLNDLSNKVCISKKTEDLNIHVFNMITGKNESKILTKDVSCRCKCKFDRRKYSSYQKCNNDKCWCECKKHHMCETDYVWNPPTCSCENGKCLASIIDVSLITCNQLIEEIKTVPTNFNGKKVAYESKNIYILLAFLLITIVLLIAVSIYCYWAKKKQQKKKHTYYHFTSQMTN